MPRPRKPLSIKEKEFARLVGAEEYAPVQAARVVFGWKCEPGSSEAQKARDLVRAKRVKEAVRQFHLQKTKELEAERVVNSSGDVDLDRLIPFLRKRLEEFRDADIEAQTRLNAIDALEKLADPSADVNLVMRWVDLLWRFSEAHCPCCHRSFPLHEIRNEALIEYREESGVEEPDDLPTTDLDRRLYVLGKASPLERPHEHVGQRAALGAPERHLVGLGAARGGKSLLLACFGLLELLIPGTESWLVAKTYREAEKEKDYILRFFDTLFHPYGHHVVKKYESAMDGTLKMVTKWGSILEIRSATARASITGHELDLAMVAEPGWVPAETYEELRARMSSRLGRILALGTPKGETGFIARMVRTMGRDEEGRIIRRRPEDRLIENGCPWNVSMMVFRLRPEDNPAYVKSELNAARQELTDEEYASEFRGQMTSIEGAAFPYITDDHLVPYQTLPLPEYKFILGIDQGPTNFAAVLVGWNGHRAVACWEFFDNTERTMRANLVYLHRRVPQWIHALGGRPENWGLTITDQDPPVWQILDELAVDGKAWPHDIVTRHQNRQRGVTSNWRRECQEWVNNLSKKGRLLFATINLQMPVDSPETPGAALLHDQLRLALDRPDDPDKESKVQSKKTWIVHDKWRGDHPMDAWFMAMWCILSGQVPKDEESFPTYDPMVEARKAWEYQLLRDEMRELGPSPNANRPRTERGLFQEIFGRPPEGKRSPTDLLTSWSPTWYPDEG